MKKISLLFLLSFLSISMISAQPNTINQKILRHVVLFKFNNNSSEQDIITVENAFRALPSKINLIIDFEWGINNSPENLNQGFSHFFFASFTNEKDRDDYLIHPDHKAFVALLSPFLEKVLVIDYWAGK